MNTTFVPHVDQELDGEIPFDDSTTVDGTEARIIEQPPLIEPPAISLPEEIKRLEDARITLEDATLRAKEAAANRKAAQDALNRCVDAVIRGEQRNREPGLPL